MSEGEEKSSSGCTRNTDGEVGGLTGHGGAPSPFHGSMSHLTVLLQTDDFHYSKSC